MNIETLLSTRGLVVQTPTTEEIIQRVQTIAPKPIKLFYGETYDDKGHTIDSLKYYLFLSFLADALREEGANVDPSILIADSAACRNIGEKHERYYMVLGEERANFVRRVNSVYSTGLRVVKMSDYIDSQEFIEERTRIMNACKTNTELMDAIEKTVPESKIDTERQKGFLYSFDEIATIMGLDLKVGPPREDLYDDIARKIASERGRMGVMSLFLTQTFPLGMNWSYFFANEGIEDHGITPYKAGSKRLQKNRIIIERSNPDYIRGLINSSFISHNPALPNPILDIGIISEMAKRRLEGDNSPITLTDDFYEGRISDKQLREIVGRNVEVYILSQF